MEGAEVLLVVPHWPRLVWFVDLDKGLATDTLRRQVAALVTILFCDGTLTLSQHPRVRSFFKGASTYSHQQSTDTPLGISHLVLQALTSPPFEPLGSTSLKLLTFKVAFLVAIISAQ